MNPLKIIKEIRESQPEMMIIIFTEGSCYRFYKILKSVFPNAEPYYDSNHVITKIKDKFYDITGEVKPNELHRPMSKDNFTLNTMNFYEAHYYDCPIDYDAVRSAYIRE